jgi:hypothetical protein
MTDKHVFILEKLRSLKKTYDELTPEEKELADQESEKCKADPVYFYANYWKVDGRLPTNDMIKHFRNRVLANPELFPNYKKREQNIDNLLDYNLVPEFLKKKL